MTAEVLLLIEKLTALAQGGMAYSPNVYDRDRYNKLRALTAELYGLLCVPRAGSSGALDYLALFPVEDGYRTPKIDVRAFVVRGDSVLLVHEKVDECWALPGGWADIGETPTQNVVKEVWEESGYAAQVVRLLALLDNSCHQHGSVRWWTYKAFYLCTVSGEPSRGTMETLGADFFPITKLPRLSVGRVTEAQIQRLYRMVQTDERTPWID